jgi:hypothetical protein
LDRRLGGPQNWSGHTSEEKNTCPHKYFLCCLIVLVEFGIQNAGIWTGKDQKLLQKMNVEVVEIFPWTIRY